MKVLVTGAAGQLGSIVVRHFAARADVVASTRADLDIGNAAAVESLVERERPHAVVNCAAYNDVDGAEDCPVDALRVNTLAVRTLARASLRIGAILVHYGTDFVFDGGVDRLHAEDDEPAPRSVYGLSKLLGEWFAMDAGRHYVLRVASLFGGDDRRSRIDRIADALRRGERPRVFADRTVTPSYAPDVAEATWKLIAGAAPPGLYHCVNSGTTNWLGLAREIARRIGVPADVIPASVADVSTRAQRPQYPALSNAKLARAGIVMAAWEDAVGRHLTARLETARTG
jgi:dTDP-4-dehydrorhamnose reductase